MLTISGEWRSKTQNALARALREERLVRRVTLQGTSPDVQTESWRRYWQPLIQFAGTDTRLIQRLNRLKAAWRGVLRQPAGRQIRERYCWRFFGLLHYTLRIAAETKRFSESLHGVRCIVGFESFVIDHAGLPGTAAAIACRRNPIFLLGRLPSSLPPPTPRHVPLVMPEGARCPSYHYRQYKLADSGITLLLFPTVELSSRQASFAVIDRFARATCNRRDPHCDPRAKLLARRVLAPLLRAFSRKSAGRENWRILDLGAGTGHLVGNAWGQIRQAVPSLSGSSAELVCVDSSEPSVGRSYGLSGRTRGISSLEWKTADYRRLLDNDDWLQGQRPFQIALLSRLLDNLSLFSLDCWTEGESGPHRTCYPHYCLSPRSTACSSEDLQVRTTVRRVRTGRYMPQHSLNEYFIAMKALWLDTPDAIRECGWVLPFRRFNPAALITQTGRSVIAQLLVRCAAIVIEDPDLTPDDLLEHALRFGLRHSAGIQFVDDGFTTEVGHFVITRPEVVAHLKGKRLW